MPPPTGRFPVGRTRFDWIDPSRGNPFAPQQGSKRELTVWIWYPALLSKSSTPSEYLPMSWRTALAEHQGTVFQHLLLRDLSRVRCHSFDNAAVASDQSTYPVILMKPGIGAQALDYTTLAEDLASHGYIVVASDSPYSTFLVVYSDGRVVLRDKAGRGRASEQTLNTWVADNRFLLDRLTELNRSDPSNRFRGHLNLQKVGVLGHSFGGATAAEFCHVDRRCKAGIDLDGAPYGQVIRTSLRCPFLFLVADHSGPLEAEDRQILANIRTIYDGAPSGRCFATVRGSGHFSFSDRCLLLNSTLTRVSGALGKIGEERGLRVAAACIRTFFDVHLQGAAPSSMDRLPLQYPEVAFGFDKL